MKKIIVIVVVLLAAGGGAYAIRGRADKAAPAVTPTGKVERTGLRQVVASTGKVVSNLDVDIKCKASGEIVLLPFEVSDGVKKGDLLLQLDPVDEERAVRQSQAALNSSQARRQIAEVNLAVAKMALATDTDRAKVALDAMQARAKDSRVKAERAKDLLAKKLCSQEECETAETTAVQADADARAAEVRIREMETAKEALKQMEQQVRLAESQVESDAISLDLAKQRLADTKVPAPIEGVVTASNVQIGQIISSGISNIGGGTTALTLSDLSRIFVLASVDESDIGRVKVGQDVAITVDAHPGKKFNGKVVRIATMGTVANNVVTFEVKIEVQPGEGSGAQPKTPTTGEARTPRDRPHRTERGVDVPPASNTGVSPANTDGNDRPRGQEAPATHRQDARAASERGNKSLLKPMMTANVEIVLAERDDVLTVPSEAVVRKAGKNTVTVMDGAAPREVDVEVGLNDGTRTEILSGLAEGQTVQLFKADSKWQQQQQRPITPGRMMGGRRG